MFSGWSNFWLCLACEDGFKLADNKCTKIENNNCVAFIGENYTTYKGHFTGEESDNCGDGYKNEDGVCTQIINDKCLAFSGETCTSCVTGYEGATCSSCVA